MIIIAQILLLAIPSRNSRWLTAKVAPRKVIDAFHHFSNVIKCHVFMFKYAYHTMDHGQVYRASEKTMWVHPVPNLYFI